MGATLLFLDAEKPRRGRLVVVAQRELPAAGK
jgi:hypothetical protein